MTSSQFLSTNNTTSVTDAPDNDDADEGGDDGRDNDDDDDNEEHCDGDDNDGNEEEDKWRQKWQKPLCGDEEQEYDNEDAVCDVISLFSCNFCHRLHKCKNGDSGGDENNFIEESDEEEMQKAIWIWIAHMQRWTLKN